ncbi:MAG: putative membrane protein YdjX (TVP38/TMEM64 family) [Pirellulaceae bacterium]|jgi:uncharacterized membrane protein YdjX (TVP38/TMEM64 family)
MKVEKTDAKPRSYLKLLVFGVVVIAGVYSYKAFGDSLSLTNLAARETELRDYQTQYPALVIGIAFLVYVTATGLSLPGATVLTIAYGWYFGLARGLVLVSFASTAGATLAFLLSRYLLRDTIEKRFGERLEAFHRNLEREGAFYLFSLRLIPAVPFFVINAVMGLTQMKTRTFWWVSQLGMLAGERELMGGDCLNVGCVPSKGIISAARVAATVREAGQFGIEVTDDWEVNFAAVMERMRRLRAGISPHDSAARFRDLGIDVFIGSGKFTATDTIEVGGQKLKFKRAVIATGARAAQLPIPGLIEVAALTNESIFSLTELPARLTVIGGGPIGSEMAQAFARFGSKVVQIEKAANILSREDRDAALIVQNAMQRDGVQMALEATTKRFEKRGNQKVAIYEKDGREHEVISDEILIELV